MTKDDIQSIISGLQTYSSHVSSRTLEEYRYELEEIRDELEERIEDYSSYMDTLNSVYLDMSNGAEFELEIKSLIDDMDEFISDSQYDLEQIEEALDAIDSAVETDADDEYWAEERSSLLLEATVALRLLKMLKK